MVLPAAALATAVLATGLGTAVAQSVGLTPLTGTARVSLAAWEALVTDRGVLDGLRVSLGIASMVNRGCNGALPHMTSRTSPGALGSALTSQSCER